MNKKISGNGRWEMGQKRQPMEPDEDSLPGNEE